MPSATASRQVCTRSSPTPPRSQPSRRRSCSPICWRPPIARWRRATGTSSPPAARSCSEACWTPKPRRSRPRSRLTASASRRRAASRDGPASPFGMRRFTLQPDQLADGRVTFDAGESNHLARVLRLRPGDTIVATDGAGHDYTVRLESLGEAAVGTVLAVTSGAAASPLAITLIQGVPKGDKMETIVRAATELGVARVLPALCERTIVRLEMPRWRDRARRWQRVAREAAKQSGRAVIPEVETPRPLSEWLAA